MASLPLISHTTHLPLSAFTAAGPDAARFLQGQLTQDTERLRPMQPGSVASHQLTGACTPKGRLLASLQQWAPSDQVLGHLCPTALAPALVKRLRMYVLRAKVQVELTPWVVYGAWMTQCEVPVGDGMQLSEALWCLRTADAPSAVPRAWLVGDEAQLTSFLKGQPTPPGPRQAADWWAADIQAGWPTVWPETAEAFVPQMLNFDLLDGIGFKKGCYTGQEVVARSQYLGKLNRRMFWLQAAEAAGLPFFELNAVADSIVDRGLRQLWRLGPGAAQLGAAVAGAMGTTLPRLLGEPLEAMRVVIFGGGGASSDAVCNAAEASLAAIGIAPAGRFNAPAGEMGHAVQRLRSLSADLLLHTGSEGEIAALFRGFREEGWRPRLVVGLAGG
ncbi:MAG: hypothetical protein EBR88_02520, partial [Betaproteobacteria bacterium]|nr:hypothetical protein [Betaproteobacteria bacterium]